MEELFEQVARAAVTLVEAMAVLVVTYGACEARLGLIRVAAPSASLLNYFLERDLESSEPERKEP